MTTNTRAQYLALFPSPQAAIEHEQTCLAIGSEFRPPCADLVLTGAEPTPEYWAWLVSQLDAQLYADLLTPADAPRAEPAPPAPFTVNELATFLALVEDDIERLEARMPSGRTTYTSRQMRGLADRVRLHLDAAR